MNNIVKKQLEACKVADLPAWDDNTVHIVINRKTQLEAKDIQLNHYYIVKLADYILHEPEGFTLSTNWNAGKKPETSYLKCCVTKSMGKMLFVEGIGYDYENKADLTPVFNGWLPSAGIKVMEEI